MPLAARVPRLVLATLLIAASFGGAQDAAPPARPTYATEPWLAGLTLPVALAADPDGGDRLLVVALDGVVRTVRDGQVREVPFLALRRRVTGLAGEQGLFTVAIETAAAAAAAGRARQAVAAFTEIGTGDLIIAAYAIDEAAWSADPASEVVVLRVPMPEPFHHGGQVRFGPDGALYASIGTGERSPRFLDERPLTAQSLATLRGKVVRLWLLPAAGGAPYAVPNDNPFVAADAGPGGPVRPEIWAVGFRNPWKFAFDPRDGAALVADVGEDRWEEVNRVEAGGNYGWPIREGQECFVRPDVAALVEPACAALDLAAPWIAYAHPAIDPEGGLAVTGGVVVVDPELPGLVGRYVFGDFVTGRVWAWDEEAARREVLVDTGMAVTAIEAGPAGELLLVGVDGSIVRLRVGPAAPPTR